MNNTRTLLSISGMFRSGTTLLARLLHTHTKIIIASDTMAEFFKSIRNEIYEKNGIGIKPTAPFDSNFCNNNASLRNLILNSNFNIDIKSTSCKDLQEKVRVTSEPFSPIFASNLSKVSISSKNYLDFFKKLLSVMEESYPKPDVRVLGFKTVWTEQFQTAFLNTFPNGKVLFIVRDPRSVIASNFVTSDHRYPMEFLIRQWRKSVFYALMLTQINERYKDRCLLIKYEDLIRNPNESVSRILDFLKLDSEDALLNPSNFRDGKNEKWVQNTSYENPEQKFNVTSIEKWKKILDPNVIKFVEYSCYPEMMKLKYDTEFIKMRDTRILMPYPPDHTTHMANWIKEFYPVEKIKDPTWQQQVADEEFKRICLYLNKDNSNYTDQEIEKFFIDLPYYNYLIQ